MSEHRVEINPDEWFAIADPTILAEEYESVIGDMWKIGQPKHGPAYLFTFRGKLNNKDEQAAFTVALSLQAAWELVGNILDGLELFKQANEGKE
ncbi:MAG TPA: hypothetical protein VHV10_01390 [Ktedonobacteraceae bacterium]|jgi:hypothetical protein|nr:hypothetical protein [Ktedonobacteraceae bacterium]